MGSRMVFILILVLVTGYTYADARSLETMDTMATKMDHKQSSEVSGKEIPRNEQLCTYCEEFTSQAINYLSENETQTQIINTLHEACSRLNTLKKKCTVLVDYYAPLFFAEIATILPEQLCGKVNLCEKMSLVHLLKHDDACDLCHQAVVQILLKLKDPDIQLEIIQILLKGCNKAESFAKECKRLVFEYGPLILINVEGFLEKTDLCATIHACKGSQVAAERQVFFAAS